MCRTHWRMVPRQLQALVWRYYRRGQEVRKDPSTQYQAVQRVAVGAVAEREGYSQEAIRLALAARCLVVEANDRALASALREWIDV